MIDCFKLLLERVGDAVVPLRNCSDTVVCCQVLSWQYFLHWVKTAAATQTATTVDSHSQLSFLLSRPHRLLQTVTEPVTVNTTHPESRPTQVSRYKKGKTNLDFTEARDSEWQWHQLYHMQVCTSLQTDNHASTPPLCFLQAGWPSCHPTNGVKALKALCDKYAVVQYLPTGTYLLTQLV